MAISKIDKKKVIEKFATEKNDTGSPEVQIGLLSFEVDNLQKHITDNKHDHPSKRALVNKVAKRRRLLRYLNNMDSKRYAELLKKVGLKK